MANEALKAKQSAWMSDNPLRKWRRIHRKKATDITCPLSSSVNSISNWERGNYRPSAIKMAHLATMMQISQLDLEGDWSKWEAARPSAEVA